jgi:hypothetical protein
LNSFNIINYICNPLMLLTRLNVRIKRETVSPSIVTVSGLFLEWEEDLGGIQEKNVSLRWRRRRPCGRSRDSYTPNKKAAFAAAAAAADRSVGRSVGRWGNELERLDFNK